MYVVVGSSKGGIGKKGGGGIDAADWQLGGSCCMSEREWGVPRQRAKSRRGSILETLKTVKDRDRHMSN